MTLFILTETSAGYALLKAKDKKLLSRDDIAEQSQTAEGACGLFKLKKFEKFSSAASALEEVAALGEGKVTPMLASLLDSIKDEKKASLAVADPKLGMSACESRIARSYSNTRQETQSTSYLSSPSLPSPILPQTMSIALFVPTCPPLSPASCLKTFPPCHSVYHTRSPATSSSSLLTRWTP